MEHELTKDATSTPQQVELNSGQIYHIEPMPFPGFLAFDPEFLYLYLGPRDEKQGCQLYDALKLRQSLVVSAIIPIDLYDAAKYRNVDGSSRLRYLVGTEDGELYMVVVNLSAVSQFMTQDTSNQSKAQIEAPSKTQVVSMEFLGARFSSCTSLVYMEWLGLVYYTSSTGDAYMLKICSENMTSKNLSEEQDKQEDLQQSDRPYVQVIEEH